MGSTVTIDGSGISTSISITGDTGGALTGAAFTFTGGTTGLTFAGSVSTETLGGTLAIANGGTNATSMTNTDGVVYYDGTRLVTTAVGTVTHVLTSNGVGVAPTFQAIPAGGIVTINGDSGSVTGSTIAITGGTSGAVFTGSGTTLTESFNYLSLPTTTSTSGQIKINSIPFLHSYGNGSNTFVGSYAGNFTFNTTPNGIYNTAVGNLSLNSLTASSNGSFNTTIGALSMQNCTTGYNNSCFGFVSMNSLQNGFENVGFGFNSLRYLTSGNNCIAIGNAAGNNYTSSESGNISIGASGTTGESNKTRIGYRSGTASTQTGCFIDGITGVTTSTSGAVTFIDTTGNLGTVAGGAMTMNTGTNALSISSDASATTVNIATGAASKTVALGSTNTTSATTINSGSGGIIMTGVASVAVANKNYVTINTSTGALGSDSGPTGGTAWSTIASNQTAAVNNGYFCNKAGTLALALPATSAVGDIIEVSNINTATGIQLTQAASQQIFIGNTSTTLGATGTLTSSAIGDSLKLVCQTANLTWYVVSGWGNWTPA